MVGSAVVRELVRRGYDNLLLKTRQEVDLFSQKDVSTLFEKERPEYVILCAAKVGSIKANMKFQADFLIENLLIQNNVIWAAHQFGTKKLLFLGSSCIYPRNCPQPLKEEYLLSGKFEPTNEGYAVAKISGIKLCEKIYEQFGQIFISCIPCNLYGKNDNFDLESSHVIPALVKKMYDAKVEKINKVFIWGSGNALREFLYVDDLAEAVCFLMENYSGKDFLNIGTGSGITVRELALLVKEIVGYAGTLNFDILQPEGMPKKVMDVQKINNLGWRPRTSLKEGLGKTLKYYIENYCEKHPL